MNNGLHKVWRPFPGYWSTEIEFATDIHVQRAPGWNDISRWPTTYQQITDQRYFSPFGTLIEFTHLNNADLFKSLNEEQVGRSNDF